MSNHKARVAQLQQNKTYKVRLTSGAWVTAEFLSQETLGTFGYIRKRSLYHFRNIATGRTISLRSMVKIREIEGGAQ